MIGALSAESADVLFIDVESIRDHLEAAQAGGDISIALQLCNADAAAFSRTRQILSSLLGAEADVADTVSAILFSYLVKRTAAATRITLAAAEAPATHENADQGANVVSLRGRITE